MHDNWLDGRLPQASSLARGFSDRRRGGWSVSVRVQDVTTCGWVHCGPLWEGIPTGHSGYRNWYLLCQTPVSTTESKDRLYPGDEKGSGGVMMARFWTAVLAGTHRKIVRSAMSRLASSRPTSLLSWRSEPLCGSKGHLDMYKSVRGHNLSIVTRHILGSGCTKTAGYHNENGAAQHPWFLHFNERMCRSQFFLVHSSPLYT